MNMTLSELINEILSEWAYRVDDGMPNPKNPIHLKELSVVLSEMGLSHIKSTLIENITEAEEGSFKNPVLNKKVKYKNTKGEDAEGIVGNMLRLPKEHPGRKAAEAMIPKDGTPERDALNKDLGGEGQPAKPEDEKGKEGGEDKGGEEDKAAAAQAMFDPKADPAMGARLDREKAANDKLAADAEKDKEAEKPKEEPTPGSPEDFKNKADKVAKQKEEAKKKGYNDSLHAMSDNQLDSAINDAQKKMHDAQKSGDDKAADKANTEYAQHKVEQEMRKASKGGDKEIADAAVGNFLARKKDYEEKYGEPYEADIPYPDSDGGERTSAKWGGEEPTGPEAGPNEEPPANEPSKPDTTPPVDAEKPKTSKKIKVRKPIQSAGEEEPTGASTQYPEKFHMGGAYYSSNEDGSPEFKSVEGKLIPLSDTEKEFIKVNKLDPAVLGRLDKLAADGGTDIEAAIKNTDYEKSLKDKLVKYYKDKPKTKPKEAPSEPAKREPANDDPESKAQQFKGNKSGENIQTMEMEGGGFVYGTKHGNTAMVDDILDDVKSKIPKERWGDIVFVGEGGATGESGEVEFNDEMDYAAPKFKELGAGVDTWDGDEMDVHNDQSKLYQKQKEKTGFNDSQVKAGNWASMIGQGEGTDTMSPNDFLDDEGKGFLQNAAKEAGFPSIENWDEPTEQDKDTLYRLSFPKDNGDKPTKINDIQVAFNDARDENLIEKNKELTAQGKIPITIAGEGHVDLVDKMSRKGEQPSTTEPAEPSAEPETPSAKKPDIVIPGEKPGTVVRKSDGKPDVVVPGKKASDEKPKDAEKPEDKKDDEDIKKEKPGQQATSSSGKKLYSVGGGYYSDKPNGAAKYVRTESIVELMFDDVLNEDIFALFEKTISATLSNGKKITVQELPPRAQKKATQKARKAAAAYKEPDAKPPVIAPPGVKPKAPTDAAPPIGTKAGAVPPTPPPPPPTAKKAGAVPPPPPPPPPTAKKADEPKADNKFNPIPPQDVQSEIPQADPDTFGAASDIPDGIEKQDLEKFNTDISKVQQTNADAKARGEKAPNINLCDLTVPGTNLYCDDNLGIPRDQMPQFKGKPVPGSKAEKMPLNKDGEVDTEPIFREMLKEKGIKTTQTEVPADKLKATQSELGGDKVTGMLGALEKDPNNASLTGPIYVSRDGFVIDGHHRWAAIAAYNAKYPDKQIPMKCEVIDMDIKDAIPMCNEFAENIGIASKKQGETTGKAGEEQPKEQLPEPEKPSEEDGGTVYSVGGGYYSDTPGGPAQYMASESVVEKVLIEGDNKFSYLLFEATVTKKTSKGKSVKLVTIDPKDQNKASAAAAAVAQSQPPAKVVPPGVKSKAPTNAPPPIGTKVGAVPPPPPPPPPSTPTSAPKLTNKIKKKIEKWTEKEKAFFEKNQGAPGSKERRSLGQALKDKAAGAWEAIKKGAKHEVEEFKAAGSGVKNFFSGNPVSEHEQKAIKSVAFKVVTTAVFGAAFGGLSHGVVAFGKHVAIEFIPHVIGETLLKGVGKAAIFADTEGEAEIDANMIKFTELIAKRLEEMPIPDEMMEQMVDSYNQKKEDTPKKKEIKMESLIRKIISEIKLEAKEGESKKYPGYWHKGGGYYSKQADGDITHKTVDGGMKKLTAKEKAEKNKTKPPSAAPAPVGKTIAPSGFRKTGEKELEPNKKSQTNKKSKKNKQLDQNKNTKQEFNKGNLSKDGVTDEEFAANKKIKPAKKQMKVKELEKFFLNENGNCKFPKKYFKVLARLLSTKPEGVTISDFTDVSGQGTLPSTMGELLTLMAVTIKDDNQAKEFFDTIRQHVKDNGSDSIIDIGWVNSAEKVRKTQFARYDRKFGKGKWELDNMAWDVAGEVEALGMDNYKQNKGFSTDVYAKVKVNGEYILDEISLKKELKANLLNSTSGRVADIMVRGKASDEDLVIYDDLNAKINSLTGLKDKQSLEERKKLIAERDAIIEKYNINVPDDVKVANVQKKQRLLHENFVEKGVGEISNFLKNYCDKTKKNNRTNILKTITTTLNQMPDYSKKLAKQLDTICSLTPKGGFKTADEYNKALKDAKIGDSSDMQKMNMAFMAAIRNENPQSQAAKSFDLIVKNSHNHSKAVREFLINDPDAKKGLFKSIRGVLPLKALFEGEENMILADVSIDDDVLKEVFGVSSFEELEQKLVVRDNPPPPSIVYRVTGKEDIPVAEISSRPDGIGYGGTWKLEMRVHPDFAKKLKEANQKLNS